MKVKRVINNNVICAIDEKGNEMIVTGKGLGFKKKTGEIIDPSKVERYYRMESKESQKKLRELVEQIPIEHLELTEKLISFIKSHINQPLNESLMITLADHISFAIKRKQAGIEFENPLATSIMCYYPNEYHLGQYCLKMIEQECKTELHPDEASFIAHHIVNAEMNTSMSEMHEMTKLMDGCIRVAEFYYQKKFDRESLDFNRFVVHLRYLIQRIFQNQKLPDETEDFLDEMIRNNCKVHYECANRIAAYIDTNFDKHVSEKEKIYLTIHLKRLNMKKDKEDDLSI